MEQLAFKLDAETEGCMYGLHEQADTHTLRRLSSMAHSPEVL